MAVLFHFLFIPLYGENIKHESIYDLESSLERLNQGIQLSLENLANVNTVGYKKHVFEYDSVVSQNSSSIVFSRIDFSQGTMLHTGHKLHFAIAGEGFFLLKSKSESYLSRSGIFHLNNNGELISTEGFKVSAKISKEYEFYGDWFIVDNYGRIYGPDLEGDAEVIGRIHLYDVKNTSSLKHRKNGGFSVLKGSELKINENDQDRGKIFQGFLELSNVKAELEMHTLKNLTKFYKTIESAILMVDPDWKVPENHVPTTSVRF
ncbi:MAG: flagellar hook basal-body protein [Spirochaetia bacterium]|nr:flagellar hook basal-body protein [Spirochaetia bacterium]